MQMNKFVTHAFLKEEHHVHTEQRGEERRRDNTLGRKHRDKMAAVQKPPELCDFWQKDIRRYLMVNI